MRAWSVVIATIALLLAGCSEYYLHAGLQSNPPPLEDDSEEPPAQDEEDAPPLDDEEPDDWDEIDDPPPDGPEEVDLPSCEDTIMADWQWWGSQPFEYADDPTDYAGRPFYAVDYDMLDYSTVLLPDMGHTPPGMDRVYRATFDLWNLPPALFLSMQSDDGMAFWVNGTLVGEWGGGWQAEGCVNDDSNCSEFVIVPPQDITDLLVEGYNVVAARVSNPVMNAFFDTYTECKD